MKSNYLLLLVMGLSVLSCQTKLEHKLPPEGVIGKEKMIEILADLHLAEARGYVLHLDEPERVNLATKDYSMIFRLYSIDKPMFDLSWEWYMKNPAVFEKVYEKVIETIKEREKKAITIPITDSTKIDNVSSPVLSKELPQQP